MSMHALGLLLLLLLLLILLSTGIFLVSSLPQYHETNEEEKDTLFAFAVLEAVCVVFFTGEYVLRLLTAPTPARYATLEQSNTSSASLSPRRGRGRSRGEQLHSSYLLICSRTHAACRASRAARAPERRMRPSHMPGKGSCLCCLFALSEHRSRSIAEYSGTQTTACLPGRCTTRTFPTTSNRASTIASRPSTACSGSRSDYTSTRRSTSCTSTKSTLSSTTCSTARRWTVSARTCSPRCRGFSRMRKRLS